MKITRSRYFIPLIVLILGLLIVITSVVSVRNGLNKRNQSVKGATSRYSSALSICSKKIQGVWIIADQYMNHESDTFKEYARIRSDYLAAAKAFEEAKKSGDMKNLTTSGDQAVKSAMAFRVQVESNPQLKASETMIENMRNMQEATNEIKTSLDDWIFAIQDYNTYRGNTLPSIIGRLFPQFPGEVDYFEGEVTSLNIDSLKPKAK